MPKTPAQLLHWFTEHAISTQTTEHVAVHTVEQSQQLRGQIPGLHSKNLFLKDKKGHFYLIVAEENRAVDLKQLRKSIGAGSLSFARAQYLREHLGVEPGSVTPFAVINDTDNRVRLFLDQDLATAAVVNFHPLTNTATTSLSGPDLVACLERMNHPPELLDFDGLRDA